MKFIKKDRLVHGYNEYVPFEVTDRIIELMEKIKNNKYDDDKLSLSLRTLTSCEVLDFGKSFLKDTYSLNPINYVSGDNGVKIATTKSLLEYEWLTMAHVMKINPLSLPVDFKLNDEMSAAIPYGSERRTAFQC